MKISKCFLLSWVLLSVFFTGAHNDLNASEFNLTGPKSVDGNVITFSVSVQAVSDTDAFGFDLVYDPNLLSFLNFERGTLLARGFSHLAAREVTPGRVRVGGMDVGGYAIPAGATGCILDVRFELPGGCSGNLAVTDPQDDLATLTTTELSFDMATDLASLIQILKILTGADTMPNPCISDIDGNQRIGTEEAIHILQKLVRLRVE